MPVRILLADDHTLIRQGLRRILEDEPDFQVVAEAASGIEAIELALRHGPDVAIVDVAMQELNGIDAASEILKHAPEIAVLMLSIHSEERYVLRALRAGVRGYVLKNCAADDLIQAIRQVHKGETFFSPAVKQLFPNGRVHTEPNGDRFDRLTMRERQILQLLAEGNSNKDIAQQLNLSLHTVETHRWRIMEKLDLHNTAELVLSAVRRGIVT